MDRIRARLSGLLISAGLLRCGDGDVPGAGGPSLEPPPMMDNASPGGTENGADADPALDTPDGQQPDVTGGQSGTDSPDQEPAICPPLAPVGADEFQADVRLDWLLANALNAYAAEGELLGEAARADLRIVSIGTALRRHGPRFVSGRRSGTCDQVFAPARATLSTTPVDPDGARVNIAETDVDMSLTPGQVRLGFPFDYVNYSKPERLRAKIAEADVPIASADSFQGNVIVTFSYATEPLARHDLTLTEVSFSWIIGGETFGPVAPAPVPVPPECAAVEPTSAVGFANPDEALASLSGSWWICDGRATTGIEISPDGTWRSVAFGAEPRRLSGFQHEGVVVLSDAEGNVAGPQTSGEMWLELRHADRLWAATGTEQGGGSIPLQVSASGKTIGSGQFGSAQLVRMTQAVAPAQVPPFADGERAGLDACSSSEAGLMKFDSDAERSVALVGRWVGCEEFEGELEFDTAGNARFAPSAPYAGKTTPYALNEWDDVVIDGSAWLMAVSTQPLKLWLRPNDFDIRDLRPVVLSAAP